MRKTLCILFLLAIACSPAKKYENQSQLNNIKLSYAEGFTVTDYKGAKLVEVQKPFQGATAGFKYLLVPKNQDIPPHDSGMIVIRTPVENIVCTSTTHIPLLDYLDASDKLIGFPSTDYISSEKIRARIDSGLVQDLGVDQAMNIEMLAALKPELVMGYSVTGDYGQYKKIEELGIPVVINAEYLEKHPLGRAEWIKFMALLLEKEEVANTVFSMIESNYLSTKSLVETEPGRPTSMSGVVYGDVWFMPGGQNYASKILNDAGYNYLWGTDLSNGFLKLSFESVYEKAHEADYWIGVASYNSLGELYKADSRYGKFKAFKTGHVYTYDARKGAKGGSEFLELGYLRPDIILKDLVKIAYPSLLPDHQLYFYKKLE